MSNILLIGNGPAALSKEMGDAINSFDGEVCRFNNYKTEGFEQYVGSRTDIWVTCEKNIVQMEKVHKNRYFISWRDDEPTTKTMEAIKAERIPFGIIKATADKLERWYPSSGAITAEFFISRDYHVWLWGFDFLCERRHHHYNNDKQERGPNHDEWKEWEYFHSLIEKGKASFFGIEEGESSPIFRQPVPCGKDNDISWYRTAAHNAWYEWFGSLSKGKSILDVGAGVCEGMKALDKYSPDVKGIDIDERLLKLDPRLSLKVLDEIPDESVDVITCIDVIEHVVKDMELMDNMKRVARDAIFVTTPCYIRSRCGNIAHCREYSIPQFMNFFKPTEIWSASPDGSVHLTKVLSRKGNIIRNHSSEGPDNKKESKFEFHNNYVPIATKFNNTVDGEEWAHIAACFYKEIGIYI